MAKIQEEIKSIKKGIKEKQIKGVALSDDELEKVPGGICQSGNGYSSILGPVSCPSCDNYTATYYYRNRKCVRIDCPCGYVKEDENGI